MPGSRSVSPVSAVSTGDSPGRTSAGHTDPPAQYAGTHRDIARF
ncbi:hypothetical protein ACF7ID_14210 [Staphylococcus aureus]